MNRRLLGNLLVYTLLILLGSGVAMYLTPFSKGVASMHTFFGLLFILGMLFHLINNKKPLANHLTGKRKSAFQKVQGPLIGALLAALAAGLYFHFPVLHQLYDFGNQLRNSQLGKVETPFEYQIITMSDAKEEHVFEIELKKGPAFQYPLFAVWIEDSTGRYVETLYISRVIASSSFDFGEKIDGKWEAAIKRRPEALPYWSHKRGIKAADGLYMPLHGAKDLDGVSGATPTGNFIIKSASSLTAIGGYRVLLEVNQSYDWNEYFSENRFPEDPIYSGSGQVGQPSLIYAVDISTRDLATKTYKLMELIGHGHHSGENGRLYDDLSQITTAKHIVDRAILGISR